MTATTSTYQNKETQAQTKQALHPVILQLLERRGLSKEGIDEFFSWDLKSLPALNQMHDMDKAVSRICSALEKNERIGIYGDYDVDGTTSCALLWYFFRMLDVQVDLMQPSRFVEGYGIHPSNIEEAHKRNINVLITVDCGITNNEAAQRAEEIGIDLIITDHHKDANEVPPPAFAIINPNRRDEPDDSPLRVLAGVGVAFCLALEIKRSLEQNGKKIAPIYPLLQFVAIGTICDLARLTPLNLKLVRHGLKQLPKTEYPGLKAFLSQEETKLNIIPSEKLAFNIGPLINSKGRLDHPEKALELLIAQDSDLAFYNFSHLEICNKERKLIQAKVYEEARDQVLKKLDGDDPVVNIVYNPDWHEGVIGIVASKLVETFQIPAVVFTKNAESNLIKASIRSAGDLNIFDCLNELSELFIKFGGHKAAAGLSMKEENFLPFKKRMKEIIKKRPLIERINQPSFDLEIAPQDISPALVKQLELLEPFGMGNERPMFKIRDLRLDSYDILKDVHVRWSLSSCKNLSHKFKGISFNYIGKWNTSHPQESYDGQKVSELPLSVYANLSVNRWNGKEYIQLQVQRIDAQ